MLINEFGQVVLKNETCNLDDERFKAAPLLACHSNFYKHTKVPKDWRGTVYTSNQIFLEMEQHSSTFKNKVILRANTPHELILKENSSISLTMIPWESKTEENVLFALQDTFTSLLTDTLPKRFEAFLNNKELRAILKSGVDVLYINDAIYQTQRASDTLSWPTEFQLRALVTLVRPRFVYGFFGSRLPEYIKLACQQMDFYS